MTKIISIAVSTYKIITGTTTSSAADNMDNFKHGEKQLSKLPAATQEASFNNTRAE